MSSVHKYRYPLHMEPHLTTPRVIEAISLSQLSRKWPPRLNSFTIPSSISHNSFHTISPYRIYFLPSQSTSCPPQTPLFIPSDLNEPPIHLPRQVPASRCRPVIEGEEEPGRSRWACRQYGEWSNNLGLKISAATDSHIHCEFINTKSEIRYRRDLNFSCGAGGIG